VLSSAAIHLVHKFRNLFRAFTCMVEQDFRPASWDCGQHYSELTVEFSGSESKSRLWGICSLVYWLIIDCDSLCSFVTQNKISSSLLLLCLMMIMAIGNLFCSYWLQYFESCQAIHKSWTYYLSRDRRRQRDGWSLGTPPQYFEGVPKIAGDPIYQCYCTCR